MRIVVLGDSLCLPRITEEETIEWEDTWPKVLETHLRKLDKNTEVINCGKRSRRITSILGTDFTEDILLKKPNYVIFQIGVVDAAPRIFSLREKAFLNKRIFPWRLKQWLIAERKKQRRKIIAKDAMAKVYTSPEEFRTSLRSFSGKLISNGLENIKALFIPILAHLDTMEEKSPGYSKNIELYNNILADYCRVKSHFFLSTATPLSFNKDIFCMDGYHLSKKGNQELAKHILPLIT